MKALVFHGIEDIRLEDIDTPGIGDGEILLKVHSAAICATDLRVKTNGHRTIPQGETRILGHELAGEIAETGSKIKHLKVGDRVAVAPVAGCGHCRQCISGNAILCKDNRILGLSVDGGFAQYMKIPESHVSGGNVYRLPDDISYEVAAIAEPMATVFTGMEACMVKPSDTVLIIGAGPLGLMHTLMARIFGARKVIVSEILEDRRQNAMKFGADEVVDPSNEDLHERIMRSSQGRGADAIIIAAPSPEAQVESIELAAIGGYINFFGTIPKGKEKITIDSNLIHYKNVKLFGTTGTTVLNYCRTMELLTAGRIDLSAFISAEFPLERFKEAFEFAKRPATLKVLFKI